MAAIEEQMQAVSPRQPKVLTEREYAEHVEMDEGLCLRCGAIEGNTHVEPDAEGYHCGECGAPAVVGMEQALVLDVINFKGEH